MNKMESLFEQLGHLVNEYVPELYRSEIFKHKQIYSIEDKKAKSIDGFEKYINLRRIVMVWFTGSLHPLTNLRLRDIRMQHFNGDLSPINDHPIEIINMNNYTGNLSIFAVN